MCISWYVCIALQLQLASIFLFRVPNFLLSLSLLYFFIIIFYSLSLSPSLNFYIFVSAALPPVNNHRARGEEREIETLSRVCREPLISIPRESSTFSLCILRSLLSANLLICTCVSLCFPFSFFIEWLGLISPFFFLFLFFVSLLWKFLSSWLGNGINRGVEGKKSSFGCQFLSFFVYFARSCNAFQPWICHS